MFGKFENLFKKQAPEDEINQLQTEVDILSAAALNPGSADNYNESTVDALKKAQARLEELQREIKK